MAGKLFKIRTALAGSLIAAISLIATSCKKAQSASAGGMRHIRIGMVAKSETNDVFQAAKTGAMDAARELSAKYNCDIQIDWRTPPNEDPNKQADNIRAMADEHVDGITVSCSDAGIVGPAIDDAVAKGVPVVCFDSDAPQSKRMTDYGTDDDVCGRVIMQELARVMGDKGTIAVLSGNPAAPNLALRITGLKNELAKHPNIQLLNSDGIFNATPETPEGGKNAVSRAMEANPGKINGWAFVGGWPLFTDHAVSWNPGDVKCVSCDALPTELEYLKNGQVQELVAQDCYGWGHKTVEILVDKIINHKDPESSKIPNPLTIVTKDKPDPSLPVEANCPRVGLDEFAIYWNKWLPKK